MTGRGMNIEVHPSTSNNKKLFPKLISTISGREYPLERIEEFAGNDESLEVSIPDIENAKIYPGENLWQRYLDFLPFNRGKIK